MVCDEGTLEIGTAYNSKTTRLLNVGNALVEFYLSNALAPETKTKTAGKLLAHRFPHGLLDVPGHPKPTELSYE